MASFADIRDRQLTKLGQETQYLKRYDEFLEAEQPLEFLSPVLKNELEGRIKEMVFNLPRFATEVYDQRLDLNGFRYRGKDSADDELWQVFQANDGETLSQQAHYEALGLGRSYAIVGEGESAGDVPLITAESPFQAIHEVDPRTKGVASGIKTWRDLDDTDWVSLYHPYGRLTWFQGRGGRWQEETRLQETNAFGIPRIVPLANQQRSLARIRPGARDYRLGRSVFHDIVGLTDAINKMLTDMMVSGEFHAMPRRWAVGLTAEDFQAEDGTPLKTWELIAGRIWASSNKDTKMGQFNEADLTVFHNTVKLLLQTAAMLLGLPPHYLTFTGENPTSADAIRSSETQLVKRAERIQKGFAGSWEKVNRLVLLTLGYPDTAEARSIEAIWRDPSTPTKAQEADAVTKLVTTKDGTGRSIVPIEMAREMMGFTPSQRDRMRQMDEDALRDPMLERALRGTEDINVA